MEVVERNEYDLLNSLMRRDIWRVLVFSMGFWPC